MKGVSRGRVACQRQMEQIVLGLSEPSYLPYGGSLVLGEFDDGLGFQCLLFVTISNQLDGTSIQGRAVYRAESAMPR